MDTGSPFNCDEVFGNTTLLKQTLKNQIDYFALLPTLSSVYRKDYTSKFLDEKSSREDFIENLLRTNPENERNLFRRFQGVSSSLNYLDKLSSNQEFAQKIEIRKWLFVRKLRTMPATKKDISESKSICRKIYYSSLVIPSLLGIGAILGISYKLKIHRNSSSTFAFSIGSMGFLALLAYNRYVVSLKCFELLPPLPSPSLESERMQIVRDGFLVDYRLFVANVEREYRESKLGSEFKFKNI